MVVVMSLWFLQESQRSKDVEEFAHSAEAQSVVDVAGSEFAHLRGPPLEREVAAEFRENVAGRTGLDQCH